jgi:cytochrome P450
MAVFGMADNPEIIVRNMLGWLNPENESIERIDLKKRRFEPTHPAYNTAKGYKPVQMILQARANLLAIFRKKHFEVGIDEVKILRRQFVVVNAPEAIKYVVATRHENFERKSPQMRRALEILIGDGLFISDGETWKQRRPLVSDIVHKNRVPAFGSIMTGTTEELVERWLGLGDGASVNVLHEMAGLTAEIIARSVFGNDLGTHAANEVTEGFTSYQALVDSVNLGYILGLDEGMPLLRTPSMKRSIARIHKIIDKVVEDHLAGHGDNQSMIELLIRRQKRNPELKLDVVALRNEAATIFMAGHETTAATLTWIWYLLSRAPWVEKAIHDEIARVCGDRVPDVSDVDNLEWCRAVVEEALRLYPPVPVLARQAKRADRIGDIDIKPASVVMIVPWLLHRTEALFKDAHCFKPERFLNGRPTPYSYIPFAIGPRICPGLQFGLTESILCLAVIAQRFRVKVQENHKVEAVFQLTLRPKGGMPVTLHRR